MAKSGKSDTKKRSMKTTKSLWIDHRKAVIVTVTDKGEDIKEIISHVEKQPGRFDGVRSTTPFKAQQSRRMILRRETLRYISIHTTMK